VTQSTLSGTIQVGVPLGLTGPAAFAGAQNQEGIQMAVDEINSTKFLGNAKIQANFADHAADAQQAVTLVKRMIEQDNDTGIVGMNLSGLTLAVVPVAQAGKTPTIIVESGVKGVVETGNYIFRTNIPQTSYIHLTVDHLKKLGVKTTYLLYDQGTPTIVDLIAAIKPLLSSAGIQVLGESTYTTSTTDFTAILAKVRQANPDSISVFAIGKLNVTIVTQARQQGYTKYIYGQAGFAGGVVAAGAPKECEGCFFATGFAPGENYPSSQKFAAAYQAKFNKAPSQFGAEGYDGMWLFARGLKQAGSADRDKVRAGIEKVTQQGFDGAQGPLKFENRDIRAPGVLIEITGGKETVIQP
jgi:branched-chain amino acid transport system substrate-binding protein